jgi:hypothetical protein
MPSGRSPNPLAMNKYAHMAIRHWQKTDPERYQTIAETEREAFFSQLGERAESEIQQLQDRLAGPDPPNESYLQKVGRLNMARLQAEEIVLPQLILIPAPEPSEDEEEGPAGTLEFLHAMLDRAKGERGLTVKRLEKQLLAGEQQLEERLDGPKDPGLCFEQTGIDYLLVDFTSRPFRVRLVRSRGCGAAWRTQGTGTCAGP